MKLRGQNFQSRSCLNGIIKKVKFEFVKILCLSKFWVGQNFELVKILCLSNPLELCSDHFLGWLLQPESIIKDYTVWLDEARSAFKYIFKNNVSTIKLKKATNSDFQLKLAQILSTFLSLYNFFFWLSGSQAEAQNKESLKRLYSICRLLLY